MVERYSDYHDLDRKIIGPRALPMISERLAGGRAMLAG
jgi:hypothetical protein